MTASKRPSTSSLRRFITSRPYVTIAELRRRFGLGEPDSMSLLVMNGSSAWVGLPDREATKLRDLYERNEVGLELSVEVRAPVVVGVYPMRIARYVMDGYAGHGASHGRNGSTNGHPEGPSAVPARDENTQRQEQAHTPRPMRGAPTYSSFERNRGFNRQQGGA